MSWIVRIASSDQAGRAQQLDVPFDQLASLLWDLGTTGIAEVDTHVLAGFDDKMQAEGAIGTITGLGYQVDLEPVSIDASACVASSVSMAWGDQAIDLQLKADGVFGHGRHPTTMAALDLLAVALPPAHTVSMLDVGTGTGVLAIAAAKTGRVRVTATDIDPLALTTAVENADANAVDVTFTDETADSLAGNGNRYDIVVANVLLADHRTLATPILELLSVTKTAAADPRPGGGLLLLSGYLVDQVDELLNLYQSTAATIEQVACTYRGIWAGHLLSVEMRVT